MRCRVGLMVMATTASLALGACTGNPSVPLPDGGSHSPELDHPEPHTGTTTHH